MKFWIVTGLLTGVILASLFTRRYNSRELYLKNPELCYDNEDLVTDQEM